MASREELLKAAAIFEARISGRTLQPQVQVVPNKVTRLDHTLTIEKNKSDVQLLTVEKYQWYSIEVCKAFCMREGRWLTDMIYSDGKQKSIKPFVNRPVRLQPPTGNFEVNKEPLVDAGGRNTVQWFIPWRHNARLPGFISYSCLPFQDEHLHYRLLDIDGDQLKNYGGDKFSEYYQIVCEHNLAAKKMERRLVNEFQRLLQGLSDSIVDKLGQDNLAGKPLFSGGGFRVVLKGKDPETMKNQISEWTKSGQICSSSTMGYQPQKLFSVQTLKPHFQTEIDPYSRHFKFSNPAFFFTRYNTELLNNLYEYYRAYVKQEFEDDNEGYSDPMLYYTMRNKQMELESNIIPAVIKAS